MALKSTGPPWTKQALGQFEKPLLFHSFEIWTPNRKPAGNAIWKLGPATSNLLAGANWVFSPSASPPISKLMASNGPIFVLIPKILSGLNWPR